MHEEMRSVILKQAEQIRHSIEVNKDASVSGDFDAIILAGMGGSGHPGDLLNALHLPTVPLTVHRSYSLPYTLGKNPLTIISSYSGNTEEALSAYEDAKTKNQPILVNTAGGKLLELAKQNSSPYSFIDYPGMQPRHTLFASFTGLAVALANSKLAKNISTELQKTADMIDREVAAIETPAKALADTLVGKTPVFYSSDAMGFAAKNMKIQTNENAKTAAFWNEFPELNHNEMVGMTNPQAAFHAVFLRTTTDHPQIAVRMNVTKKMYETWGVKVTEVQIKGTSLLEQISYAVVFGLWTTYHLALNYKTDPIPVKGVEDFKNKLKELTEK
ncbi:MAG TPA: bifunctional phosphoglucose/phosphomannose isomerase [Candidatus Andersenbacteria bacterium]|nr:bifunctional phosphoglucose/phosphomannose isomerase [Candidatus Andersenbacteria bacterium]